MTEWLVELARAARRAAQREREQRIAIARAEELAPRMLVLLCSGHVEAELRRRNIAAGRYPFLAKPFTPTQFLERVRS